MYTMIEGKTGAISPKRAEELLRLNIFDGQRPMSNGHVHVLRTAMADGTFRSAQIAIAKESFNGGHEVLVNGQHQLAAIVQHGKSIRGIVETYDCPTKPDLWTLFSTYDTHRPRSEQHVMKAARGLFQKEQLRDLPLAVLQKTGSALLYLDGGTKPNFEMRPMNKRRKAELVEQYADEVVRFADYYTGDTGKMIPIGVATAMVATHRTAPKVATEFWTKVLGGERLVRADAEYQLRQKLMQPSKVMTSALGGKRIHRALYNLCIAWWNTYRTGEDRQSVKVASIAGVLDIR